MNYYLAQWSDGVWVLYDGEPKLKMSGWDGKFVAIIPRDFTTPSWSHTCHQVDETEYPYSLLLKQVEDTDESP